MNQVSIRIPTPLRSHTGGLDEVVVEASSVREALDALGRRHEGIVEQVLDRHGKVRRFINVYLGDRNISALAGLETPLHESNLVISIVPAVAGGGQ